MDTGGSTPPDNFVVVTAHSLDSLAYKVRGMETHGWQRLGEMALKPRTSAELPELCQTMVYVEKARAVSGSLRPAFAW